MNPANALRKRLALAAAPKIRFSTRGSDLNQQEAAVVAQMAERGIASVMQYCLSSPVTREIKPLNPKSLTIAMRRFVAIAWLLHSELLVGELGEPLTLDLLGKLPQLDCTRCALSLLAKGFADRHNFQARVQKRKSSKPNYAASAKTGWEKRRARQKVAATK
jgi:hypothetical protein